MDTEFHCVLPCLPVSILADVSNSVCQEMFQIEYPIQNGWMTAILSLQFFLFNSIGKNLAGSSPVLPKFHGRGRWLWKEDGCERRVTKLGWLWWCLRHKYLLLCLGDPSHLVLCPRFRLLPQSFVLAPYFGVLASLRSEDGDFKAVYKCIKPEEQFLIGLRPSTQVLDAV